jgi:endonuclease V-like protein UPF0215 family
MVLAVEGGGFSKAIGGKAIMALLLTEGIVPRRLSFARIEVDGLDATEGIIEAMVSLGPRADLVLSDSVPIAGFNMIDAGAIEERTGKPTVFVLPDMPDFDAVEAALRKHFPDWSRRLEILAAAGKPTTRRLGEGEVHLECVGIGAGDAMRLLEQLTVFGKVPEPIRLARMVAREAGCLVRSRGTAGW